MGLELIFDPLCDLNGIKEDFDNPFRVIPLSCDGGFKEGISDDIIEVPMSGNSLEEALGGIETRKFKSGRDLGRGSHGGEEVLF